MKRNTDLFDPCMMALTMAIATIVNIMLYHPGLLFDFGVICIILVLFAVVLIGLQLYIDFLRHVLSDNDLVTHYHHTLIEWRRRWY